MKSVLTVIRQKMADRLAELEAARN
jgi:hypothetical protein